MDLGISLRDVPSEVGCAKVGCDCSSHGLLQRHHRGHEAMWLGVWASRRRGEERFEAFRQRYAEFRAEDVVLVCHRHHPEIHSIYDKLITEHKARTGKPLYKYSWTEAENLSQCLRLACEEWLAASTPGIDPEEYTRERQERWKQRTAEARRGR